MCSGPPLCVGVEGSAQCRVPHPTTEVLLASDQPQFIPFCMCTDIHMIKSILNLVLNVQLVSKVQEYFLSAMKRFLLTSNLVIQAIKNLYYMNMKETLQCTLS